MRYKIVLILCFIIFYLISLLYTLPAKIVYAKVRLPLSLSRIEGTIWHGTAHSLHWDKLILDKIQWDCKLLLKIHCKIAFYLGENKNTLSLSIATNQSLMILNANLKARLSDLNLPIIAKHYLTGELQGNIRELHYTKNKISYANAKFTWKKAQLLGQQKIQLGNIDSQISTQNETLVATVRSDESGDIISQGELTLDKSQHYNIHLLLQVQQHKYQLSKYLNLFSQKQKSGHFKIALQGNLLK